jgi:hypothetical protein
MDPNRRLATDGPSLREPADRDALVFHRCRWRDLEDLLWRIAVPVSVSDLEACSRRFPRNVPAAMMRECPFVQATS